MSGMERREHNMFQGVVRKRFTKSLRDREMKFALIHLSGNYRGETQYFDRPRISLGSALDNDLVFPSEGPHPGVPQHVELCQVDCAIHLKNHDPSVSTLVNSNPLVEATLHDKDLIQLGPNGPKLRFLIPDEEYASCKRSRDILRDALDVAAESRNEGRGVVGVFFGQLAYDVRRHASKVTQMVVGTFFMLLIGAIGGLGYFSYTAQQILERDISTLTDELKSARLSQVVLEQRTAEERENMANAITTREAEIDHLVSMLEEHQRQGRGASAEEVRALTRRLQVVEYERTGAEALIKRYGPSVCFLYGTYAFLENGKPSLIPSVLLEYTGTGFLIDETGLIVTNRHIMEPWTMSPSEIELVKAGMEPKLMTLVAYFPGHPQPFEVSLVGLSDANDVALGRLSPIPQDIRPITIDNPAPMGIVGEAVIVLGYPVGVESVLARMDDKVAEDLIQQSDRSLRQLIQNIADKNGFRPLATQGHIGDIVAGRVVYDAQTAGGVSGSPVFNIQGKVVAVNAAKMIRFGGASFGVPIGLVLPLISSAS